MKEIPSIQKELENTPVIHNAPTKGDDIFKPIPPPIDKLYEPIGDEDAVEQMEEVISSLLLGC